MYMLFKSLMNLVLYMLIIAHTEIYFWISQSNLNQDGAFWFRLLFTLRLIQNQIEFRLVQNRSGNRKYNMTLVDQKNKKLKYHSAQSSQPKAERCVLLYNITEQIILRMLLNTHELCIHANPTRQSCFEVHYIYTVDSICNSGSDINIIAIYFVI